MGDSMSNQGENYQKIFFGIFIKKIESIWYFSDKNIFFKKKIVIFDHFVEKLGKFLFMEVLKMRSSL